MDGAGGVAPLRDVEEGRVGSAGDEREGVVEGDQFEDGEVVGFADFVLGDEGVEGRGKLGGVEGNCAREVGVEEAFDHAGEQGDVEGARDSAGGGVGDDEGFGVVGEFEEVEVEANLIGRALFGNPDIELGPIGSVEDGETLFASLEDLHQFDHLVGALALFIEFGGFVVGGEVGDEVDDVLVALFR